MLERFFGGCDGGFFGMGWWIIILFFLFLAFGDTLCKYWHRWS